jgi:hypothetical protein
MSQSYDLVVREVSVFDGDRIASVGAAGGRALRRGVQRN